MNVRRRWGTIGGAILLVEPVWQFAKWLLDWSGYLDTIIGHIEHPGWVGAILDVVVSPPPWLILPCMIGGLGFIYLDSGRRVPKVVGSNPSAETASADATPAAPDEGKATFRVRVEVPNDNQIGSARTDLSFYLINDGDRDRLVQEVALLQRFVSNRAYRGYENYTLLCLDQSNPTPMLQGHLPAGVTEIGITMQDKTLAFLKRPVAVALNGIPARNASATIEAKKTVHLLASFSTEAISDEFNVAVYCPLIRFLDDEGNSVTATCIGSFAADLFEGGARHARLSGAPPGTYVLLPKGRDARCRFTSF